jgi:hypothetical protein
MVRPSRSVLDYDSEDALRKALLALEVSDSKSAMNGAPEMYLDHVMHEDEPETSLDWVLPCYDPETTEVQSMKVSGTDSSLAPLCLLSLAICSYLTTFCRRRSSDGCRC